jgi:hypothetical protein
MPRKPVSKNPESDVLAVQKGLELSFQINLRGTSGIDRVSLFIDGDAIGGMDVAAPYSGNFMIGPKYQFDEPREYDVRVTATTRSSLVLEARWKVKCLDYSVIEDGDEGKLEDLIMIFSTAGTILTFASMAKKLYELANEHDLNADIEEVDD